MDKLTGYTDNERNEIPCFRLDDLVCVVSTSDEVQNDKDDGSGEGGRIAKEDEALKVGVTTLWDVG